MNKLFDFSIIPESADVSESRREGETILEAGKPGNNMLFVMSGTVLIKVGDTVLETVGKGGVVGEMAMLDDSPRSASVVAGSGCEIVSIDRERCFTLFSQKPIFATELMRLIAQRLRAMNFFADHDPMTRLPNRAHLEEYLHQILTKARRNNTVIAVMAIDLDGFRSINDLLGNAVGDQLMNDAATRLRELVRTEDYVSRIGGDEFSIVVDNLSDVHNAVTLAQKLIQGMASPFPLSGHQAQLSPSIGISYFPQDGGDGKTLLKTANAAASRAREQGGHTHQFFSPELNDHALEMLTITNRLRFALEHEEFILHYQPRINLASGKVSGVEALIRWNDPQKGMISPGVFIPLAEKRGMIGAIGEWVLKEACRQINEWQRAGVPPPLVAVNLSIEQLRKPGFPASIEGILRAANLAAQFLELEVTESTAMNDAENAAIVLKVLSDMGFALAIDDFGTGYSSLSHLKRFPVTYLKIDQSFVRGIPSDHNDMAIVKTIIGMAKNLNMRLIAEGVETSEQLEFLKNAGCDEVQGYFFSKPLPPDELVKYLQNRNYA